jgi:hypothetical protein
METSRKEPTTNLRILYVWRPHRTAGSLSTPLELKFVLTYQTPPPAPQKKDGGGGKNNSEGPDNFTVSVKLPFNTVISRQNIS